MTGVLIFMIISLFLYTLFLKYYHLHQCPNCHSSKITMKKLIDHTLFTCQTCRFSYKDYYSFFTLTPIWGQLDVDFLIDEEDEEDEENDIEK